MTLGVTNGLKPDGQTTLVGEYGDVNKTFSPPHDLKKNWKKAEIMLDLYSICFVALTVK